MPTDKDLRNAVLLVCLLPGSKMTGTAPLLFSSLFLKCNILFNMDFFVVTLPFKTITLSFISLSFLAPP